MDPRMLFSLIGQTILVTGAAGHLGRALCRHLIDDGARVIAVDFDHDGLAFLESELDPVGERLITFLCDLSDEEQRIAVAQLVAKKVDALDGAVFAAAFVGTSNLDGWNVEFSQQSLSTWRQALELNLTAQFHLTQLFANLLGEGNDPAVVNVGSIYGSRAPDWALYDGLDMSNPAAYAASKAGLAQLTRWLASALAPRIRVNSVSPGGILRAQPPEFVERYEIKTPLGRMATEAEIVGAVVFMLSRAGHFVTGQEIVVDGGYSIV